VPTDDHDSCENTHEMIDHMAQPREEAWQILL
jgi:hypothetical protein